MNRRTAIHEDRDRTFLYLPTSELVQHILNQLDAVHRALDEDCEVCMQHDREWAD
jgi:hypothetical protein